ncbi:MAG TPA: MFS transporter [Myxococcales bacterium]|nr:MFS transporter [Myxococcales bacterium]
MTAAVVDARFRARRAQNWLLLGALYALFYMSRYNYSATSAYLASVLGWRNAELGIFETVMPLVYGLSVVLNGPVADRIGGKRAFLIGTAGAICANILFGCSALFVVHPAVWDASKHVAQPAQLAAGLSARTLLVAMASIWAVNGFFQSFGALSIVKVNAHWFTIRERGTFAGIFGVLIRFGLILAFSGVPLIVSFLPWQWAFWVPAALLAVFFVLNLFFMENSPEDAGLGTLDTGDASDDGHGPARVSDVLRKVFANRVTWTIAFASMCIGFVRRSVVDAWYPKYFADVFGADPKDLAAFAPYEVAAWGIAIAGILGGFAFGIASDRAFGGRRGPVITIGFGGMAVALALFGGAASLHLGPYAAAGVLVLLSFFVNGAHGMVGGAASMDFGGKKGAATAAGLFDGMQYVAGSVVGYGMGRMLDAFGWSVWTWAVLPFAVLGALLASQLWNTLPKRAPAPPAPLDAKAA